MRCHNKSYEQDKTVCNYILLSSDHSQFDSLPHNHDFNSLPNDKILDWSELKALADDKINVTQKLTVSLGWVENIVGKEESAGYQHFLLFPQRFQKATFSGSLKVGIVW